MMLMAGQFLDLKTRCRDLPIWPWQMSSASISHHQPASLAIISHIIFVIMYFVDTVDTPLQHIRAMINALRQVADDFIGSGLIAVAFALEMFALLLVDELYSDLAHGMGRYTAIAVVNEGDNGESTISSVAMALGMMRWIMFH